MVIVALVLGVMSKSMLVTLPCALVLLDYWPLAAVAAAGWPPPAAGQPAPRFPRRGFDLFGWRRFPCWPSRLAVAWWRCTSQGPPAALNTLEGVPLDGRVANALVSYVAYLGKIFWPTNLAIFYPHAAMIHRTTSIRPGLDCDARPMAARMGFAILS